MWFFFLLGTGLGSPWFLSTWQTTTPSQSITLPISWPSFSISVGWGDGVIENFSAGNPSHTYSDSGNWTIAIDGPFSFRFTGAIDPTLIRNIQSWGELTLDSGSSEVFMGCSLLQINATDQPIVLPGADLSSLFRGCSSLDAPLSWDVSNAVNMRGMFQDAANFNSPINFTNTSGVMDMSDMFNGASRFNQPVLFDTRSVSDMSRMFASASAFNQRLNFDTQSVTLLQSMFEGAKSFNSVLNFTSTANVLNMKGVFQSAEIFNQPLNWNTTSVEDMAHMFSHATSFNQPLDWDATNVLSTASMFEGASQFNSDVTLQNSQKVTTMSSMFKDARSFDGNVNLDTRSVSVFTAMFSGASSFNQPLDKGVAPTRYFDTSNAGKMDKMFELASSFNQPLAAFNISSVTDMNRMFYGAAAFNRSVKDWDTSLVTDMTSTFQGAIFFRGNLSAWHTAATTSCTNFCDQCAAPSFTTCTPCPIYMTVACPTGMGPFVSTWRTNAGNESIILPLAICDSTFQIDWGDGSPILFCDSPYPSHTYNTIGDHIIRIFGVFRGFKFPDNGPQNAQNVKLYHIHSWGGFTFDNNSTFAFLRCTNLQMTATDQPIIEVGANFGYLFAGCEGLDAPFSWDVFGVVSMQAMFQYATKLNSPLNFTNTSQLKDTTYMMQGATLFNQPLLFSDTSSVTDMTNMFSNAENFNYPVAYQTGLVKSMNNMFQGAYSFNQQLDFNTTSLTIMSGMFSNATAFNSPLHFSTTAQVQLFDRVFEGAELFNQPLDGWDTRSATTMASMFARASSFNRALNFSTGGVINMNSMFRATRSFNYPLRFDTGNVNDTAQMFFAASAFNYPLNWNTSNVVDMTDMFTGAILFKQNLGSWNTNSALSCATFCDCCTMPRFTKCAPCPGNTTATNNTNTCATCAVGTNTTTDPGVVRVPYANDHNLIIIAGGVQIFVGPDPAYGSGYFEVTTRPPMEGSVSDIVSIKFLDMLNNTKNISNLLTPIRFNIPLTPGAEVSRTVCLLEGPAAVNPECQWYDQTNSWWNLCTTTNFSTTELECSCSLLADFGAVFADNIEVPEKTSLNFSSLREFPSGGLAILVILLLFGVMFAVSMRRDWIDKTREDRKLANEVKWNSKLSDVNKFWKRYRFQLRARHTWGALVYPTAGSSFKSIDRAFVTLLVLFILVQFSAQSNGTQTSYGSLTAIFPALIMAHLFTQTGEMNYREKWEKEHYVIEPGRRWLRYRFTERWRWVWYGVVLACVGVLIWSTLSAVLVFDQDPFLFCGGNALEWLGDYVLQYFIFILLLEPFEVLLITLYRGAETPILPKKETTDVELAPPIATAVDILPVLPIIAFSEIEITTPLGKGAFGKVDQCIWRGADCAIKRLLNPVAKQEFLHEVTINRLLSPHKHQCVVSFLGVTEDPPGMLLELYPLRSVEDYVIRGNKLQSADDLNHVLNMLISASAGVLHLHANGVIHRDIAARNFLMRHDFNTAVCDMGLALQLDKGTEVGHRTKEEREKDMLPINTSAPETLTKGDYSPKSDVYMFGVFIWELLARQIPHGEDPDLCGPTRNFQSFATRILSGLQLPVPPVWPEPLRTLMQSCWAVDPATRPSMAAVNRSLRDFRKLAEEQKISLPTPLTTLTVRDSASEAHHYQQFPDGVYEPYQLIPPSTDHLYQLCAPPASSRQESSAYGGLYQQLN